MDDQQPSEHPEVPNLDYLDPMTSMQEVAIELHEMAKSLEEAGFSRAEVVIIVGQAVAAGIMLPQKDFGPDDLDIFIVTDLDEDLDEFDDDEFDD